MVSEKTDQYETLMLSTSPSLPSEDYFDGDHGDHVYHTRDTHQQAGLYSKNQIYRTVLYLTFVVVISNVLGVAVAWAVSKSTSCYSAKAQGGVEQLLYLPHETRNFTPDPLLSLPATVESNKAWKSLLGPSDGFIAIENPESYGIPPGLPHPTDLSKNVYGLSMFHQLHCLILIRERYFDLLTGRISPDDFNFVAGLQGTDKELPETANLNHGAQHIDHCFDYIQQGIRCAGQMDLEYAVRHGNTGFLAGQHQCRSWDAAMELMTRLSFNTSQPASQEIPD